MRIIKLALLSAVILFVLATAFSLLLPSEIIISRAIDIYTSKSKLYNEVNDVTRWKYWVENRDSLPVIVNAHQQKYFQLGNTNAWITSSKEKQINSNWQVGKGQILPAEFNFIEQQGSEYVTLQWKFVQQVKWYPWEKFASIVSDKVLGIFMEASLDNLKKHAEQQSENIIE